MYTDRVLRDAGSWKSQPNGSTFVLAPINDPGAHANLGLALAVGPDEDAWDYLIEYARPTGWNRGLKQESVFIRRLRPTRIGDTAAILGTIAVPAQLADRAQLVERWARRNSRSSDSTPPAGSSK